VDEIYLEEFMRVAVKEDVKSVMRIVVPYYKNGLMGFYPSIVYYSAVNKGCMWVEEVGGFIAGFIMVRVMKRTPVLRIIQIAKREGSSVRGSSLLHQAEQFARQVGLKTVILNAKKANTKAIDFYNRMGYSECGEKDDQVILQRSIF